VDSLIEKVDFATGEILHATEQLLVIAQKTLKALPGQTKKRIVLSALHVLARQIKDEAKRSDAFKLLDETIPTVIDCAVSVARTGLFKSKFSCCGCLC